MIVKGTIVSYRGCVEVMFHNFPEGFSDKQFIKLAANYFHSDGDDIGEYICFKDPELDDRGIYIDKNGNDIVDNGNIYHHINYSDVKMLFDNNIKSVYLFEFVCPCCDEHLFVYTNDDLYECYNCDHMIDISNMKPIKNIINKNYKK